MKLQGIKVVDLSVFLPGPYMTLMMADHGADVIKVEPPGGDPAREIGPRENGTTIFFRTMNRGKKSVVLNLKDAADKAKLNALVADADVFVESFRPGVMDRLGFGPERLRAMNPRLVYCSISAFGQDGPMRDVPAHDLAVEAFAGAITLNRGQDGAPAIPGIAAADMLASLHAFSAVLMALYRRETTGQGDRVDLAMFDAVLSAYPNQLGAALGLKREPVNLEERSLGGAAFYRIYETADGRHLALGGQEEKFITNLLTALGRPDLIALTEDGPGRHQQPLMDFLSDTFAQKPLAAWVEWFKGRDVCFAPVNGILEALAEPQTAHRGMVLIDEAGQTHIGNAAKFADEPARPNLALPELGAHQDLARAPAPADQD
ncbi:L-carnitine dehydratase/bile acid-inducible protein F [Stappia sp. 22II-S9-Z10]|nr:L-carnitine dehydratase/bile acid-inducible protein F [Stappia sp. 22II-S9-Z10]